MLSRDQAHRTGALNAIDAGISARTERRFGSGLYGLLTQITNRRPLPRAVRRGSVRRVDHVMPVEAASRILGELIEAGVAFSVGGGWAIDALVGRQTRTR